MKFVHLFCVDEGETLSRVVIVWHTFEWRSFDNCIVFSAVKVLFIDIVVCMCFMFVIYGATILI